MTTASIALIVMTIMFEGYSQPDLGKVLIAETALNRLAVCNCTLEEVLFQPHQYVCWEVKLWNRIPSLEMKLAWLNCTINDSWPGPSCLPFEVDEEWWYHTWYLVVQTYYGRYEIPEQYKGVTHYDNLSRFWKGDHTPARGDKLVSGQVGDHTFYRPLDWESIYNQRVLQGTDKHALSLGHQAQ